MCLVPALKSHTKSSESKQGHEILWILTAPVVGIGPTRVDVSSVHGGAFGLQHDSPLETLDPLAWYVVPLTLIGGALDAKRLWKPLSVDIHLESVWCTWLSCTLLSAVTSNIAAISTLDASGAGTNIWATVTMTPLQVPRRGNICFAAVSAGSSFWRTSVSVRAMPPGML